MTTRQRHQISFHNLLLLLLPVAWLTTGCVQTSVTRLSTENHPSTSPDSVVIYLAEEDIPDPYEKIALINAKGESSWTNEKQMMRKVRKEAAQLGANGVLLKGIDEPSAGAKVAGAFLGTGAERTGRMIAIYVSGAPNRLKNKSGL